MKLLSNPFSFTPLPVTIGTAFIYVVLVVALLVVHHVVPPPQHITGIDLDEAWLDLQTLSNGFHPYNSHRNDEIREWLLARIESLIQSNVRASLIYQDAEGMQAERGSGTVQLSSPKPAVVFSDTASNISFAIDSRGYSSYFEGTNIMVYIRGSDDDPSQWWLEETDPKGGNGVLINAHYDSVSTGYGATDDGVGVVVILQLIKYFSASNRQPKKGIVALLNNGEEDYLHGARAFSQHPLSKFPSTFLNLEGAGAGGRATLFRSTDAEVTRQYQQSPHPFGTVLSADAFKRGFVKSETDYRVFNELGMRGLDVAFYEERARYHTDQDDAKHTRKTSLYHMLSAAISTMTGLTDVSSPSRSDGQKGSEGVWFDLFGSGFAVFLLHTLFALSATLVVIAPLTLAAIGFFLRKADRAYILSGEANSRSEGGYEPVSIKGRYGIWRWPIALLLSLAVVVALAFLIAKVNPYIVYSSVYAVWSMMLSAWLATAWICLSTADHFRPTAFQRLYTILWISLDGWFLLVAATIAEQRQKIAGTYLVFFYYACMFLATTVSLLELFGLPRKSEYVAAIQGAAPQDAGAQQDPSRRSSAQRLEPSDEEGLRANADDDEDDTDERTSLIRGAPTGRTTFKHYTSPDQRAEATHEEVDPDTKRVVYGLEQPWSHSLPSYLWLLEFLLIATIPIILIGQASLLISGALSQTLADGSDPLLVYLAISILSILLLLPLGPFLHRYTYHIPLFLFLVFIGTLLYNLLAFPFSPANRLQVQFVQQLDLDTGLNNVTITGVNNGPYLLSTVNSLPSSAGQTPICKSSNQKRLKECTYSGLPPNTVPNTDYKDYLSFNISLNPNSVTSARFRLSARNTRACKILFNQNISDFHIDGSGAEDPRFPKVSKEKGSKELRLWSRIWEREWSGEVHWNAKHKTGERATAGQENDWGRGSKGLDEKKASRRAGEGGKGDGIEGQVVCLWSDANTPGTIPALDELWRFAPGWVAVTKARDGLVEGVRKWRI